MQGTTKGTIDDKFAARIADLEGKAQQMSRQFRSADYDVRPWHTPAGVVNLLDVPTMHMPAWDRYEINKVYSGEVLAGTGPAGGTVGDLIAMKTQNDFMACEERAFRLRHASYTRCAALMHGRLAGTRENNSVFSVLKTSLANTIQAGVSQS